MRLLATIVMSLILALAGTATAFAADAADRAIIGFSENGRFFAFEEFGIQDGSGFPYASIYVIDLKKDRWVEGSPVRVIKREENGSLYEARRQALNEAAPIIDKFGTIQPAKLLASNAVGEEVADPHTMVFKRFHDVSNLWTVKLTHVDLPLPPHCQSLPSVKGFALSVEVDGKEPVEVYRDAEMPESRGCPESYRLADVIAFGEAETGKAVVLVHKLTFGFEGRDARFLAVPVELPGWR